MINDALLDFSLKPNTPDLHKGIIYHLKKQGAFDESKALSIKEMAELMNRKQDYVGGGLNVLCETLGFLSTGERVSKSEINGKEELKPIISLGNTCAT